MTRWHTALLNYEYYALEECLLTSAKIKKVVLPKEVDENEATARETTDARRPQICDRVLSQACMNSVELSVSMLSEADHLAYVHIILEMGRATETWHRHQAHELRSTEASVQWMLKQLGGDFAKQLHDTISVISDVAALARCRIQCEGLEKISCEGLSVVEVVREDDLCKLLADGCMSMVCRRMMRCFWCFDGWPVRMTGLLGPPALQASTLAAFKADNAAFDTLQAAPQVSSKARSLLDRCVFKRAAVRQYTLAVEETGSCGTLAPRSLRESRRPGNNRRGKRPIIMRRNRPPPPPPGRLPIVTEISQKDASRFVPEGGYLWLSNSGGSWQAHFNGYKRISRSFAKYGQHESPRLCYVYLWEKFCEHHAIPTSECPLKGVFDSQPFPLEPPLSSRGAASSSRA